MALFGRRKPGFSKEVELKKEDITDSFSDANDPAMLKNANPKEEKNVFAQQAEDVTSEDQQTPEQMRAGEAARELAAIHAARGEGEEKVDLFDYMDALPDVEDPFTPSEEDEAPPLPEKQPGEILADYIRTCSRAAQITSRKSLAEEDEEIDQLLEQMFALESSADIKTIKGNKDEYYYSDEIMANNYAMIAMLVEEKDIAHTVAHMVRFNCKTYPSPTPFYHFMRSPYNYTVQQLEHALHVMTVRETYKDIQLVTAFNDVQYMYSTDIMSERYAKALSDGNEAGEADF